MTGYHIERAVSEQGAALCDLVDMAYQPYRDRGIALPDVTGGLADEIAAGRVWVARSGPDILGLVNLTLEPPAAHLVNVAVAPAAKGRGVGAGLIRHALALATARGCTSVDLGTHRDLPEVIALYQHLGWKITEAHGPKVAMSRSLVD